MIVQTLHEINSMSQKIQESIKKALNQTQQMDADRIPQTNYKTNSHKYNSHHHAKINSQHQPVQKNANSNSSHIHHFMLEEENQLLKQQISQLKQKGKKYRNTIKQYKRYVKFLEDYNDGLKQEVVLWMTRPAKLQHNSTQIEERIKTYRGRLNELIANRSNNEKSPNTTNYNSINMDQHLHKKNDNTQNIHIQQNYHNCSQCHHYPQQNKSHSQQNNKKLQSYSLKLNPESHDEKPQCTSCNYLEYKNKYLRGNSRTNNAYHYQNMHNKSYSYNHNKNRNSRTFKKGKNRGKLKIDQGIGSYNNRQYLNQTFNLQTYRNVEKDADLCSCHRQYVNKRKF